MCIRDSSWSVRAPPEQGWACSQRLRSGGAAARASRPWRTVLAGKSLLPPAIVPVAGSAAWPSLLVPI
eukprot:7531316-Alexandrium_andersonii.AAC.1